MVGDDVNAVSGQDLAVGVLMAAAGVDACVSQLQALNQQTTLHVERAVVIAVRKLREREREAAGFMVTKCVCVYKLNLIMSSPLIRLQQMLTDSDSLCPQFAASCPCAAAPST